MVASRNGGRLRPRSRSRGRLGAAGQVSALPFSICSNVTTACGGGCIGLALEVFGDLVILEGDAARVLEDLQVTIHGVAACDQTAVVRLKLDVAVNRIVDQGGAAALLDLDVPANVGVAHGHHRCALGLAVVVYVHVIRSVGGPVVSGDVAFSPCTVERAGCAIGDFDVVQRGR